jgi:hypothetical protein
MMLWVGKSDKIMTKMNKTVYPGDGKGVDNVAGLDKK